MELNTKQLLEAVRAVNGVIPSRSPKPWQTKARLHQDNGRLSISGGNLDSSLSVDLGVDCDPVDILTSPADLLAVLRAVKNTTTSVQLGDGLYLDDVQLPSLPTSGHFTARVDSTNYHSVTISGLKSAIKRVAYAVDNASSRYALGAICFSLSDGLLDLVTTDAKRLAWAQLSTDTVSTPIDLLIPPQVLRCLSDTPCTLQWDTWSKPVVIRQNGLTLTTRQIDGRFPRWRDIVNGQWSAESSFDAKQAIKAIKRSMIGVTRNSESRGIDLVFGTDNCSIVSHDGCQSSTLTGTFCAPVDTVSLDGFYLLDYLSTQSGRVELRFSDKHGPLRFDAQTSYILMPLETNRKRKA